MKKAFKSKVLKKRNKKIISLFLLILGIIVSFKILNKSSIKINDKVYVDYLLKQTSFTKKESFANLTKRFFQKMYTAPTSFLLQTKSNLIKNTPKTTPVISPTTEIPPPLIYIYNSHQTEEYAPSDFLEYSVKPTVMMASYILEDAFNKKNYQTMVEEESIKQILNNNKWNYSFSYKASRILLEKRKEEKPTLKYFIDVHRDSLKKERTTVTINEKSYAKILFIVGLDNSAYQGNLNFTNEINNCLNQKYPTLSKGIYKKSGVGVNGIYNQDFSPYTILVEMGGYENTTTEVLNSSLAFSECFMEVINTYESKTTS